MGIEPEKDDGHGHATRITDGASQCPRPRNDRHGLEVYRCILTLCQPTVDGGTVDRGPSTVGRDRDRDRDRLSESTTIGRVGGGRKPLVLLGNGNVYGLRRTPERQSLVRSTAVAVGRGFRSIHSS